jgi:hypothetical protein
VPRTRDQRPSRDHRWRDQQHLNQDPAQSSDVPCHHHQIPIKKRAEFQPTQRFYLTIPRPEPCIDSIVSPFGQRKRPATVSKTGTTLPCMRWQRPPLQRWFIGSLENRPPPSRSTCRLVLSYIMETGELRQGHYRTGPLPVTWLCHFRSKGPTRADIAQFPVVHAQNILPGTWLTSLPVTSLPVTSLPVAPHSTSTNMVLSVPIYYYHE